MRFTETHKCYVAYYADEAQARAIAKAHKGRVGRADTYLCGRTSYTKPAPVWQVKFPPCNFGQMLDLSRALTAAGGLQPDPWAFMGGNRPACIAPRT